MEMRKALFLSDLKVNARRGNQYGRMQPTLILPIILCLTRSPLPLQADVIRGGSLTETNIDFIHFILSHLLPRYSLYSINTNPWLSQAFTKDQ